MRFIQFVGRNAPTLDTLLGTVPAGKKWLLTEFTSFSLNAGNRLNYLYTSLAGAFYYLTAIENTVAGTARLSNQLCYVAEAGEQVFFWSDGNYNFLVRGIEFDASVPILTAKTIPISGFKTLYTCPAKKRAITINDLLSPGVSLDNIATGCLNYINNSGGGRFIRWFFAPENAVVDVEHQITPFTSVNNLARSITKAAIAMIPGDTIIIASNSDLIDQTAYATIYEK